MLGVTGPAWLAAWRWELPAPCSPRQLAAAAAALLAASLLASRLHRAVRRAANNDRIRVKRAEIALRKQTLRER